jgi:hypothetical protein
MRMVLWMSVVLAACNGDDGARHIVDGQGSGSGSGSARGAVSFDVYPDGSVYATAAFATMIDATLPSDCTQTVQGGCQLTLCTSPYVAGASTYVSAGTITAVGGTPTTTYTLDPSEMNTYTYGPVDGNAVFSDGDTITVAGTGAAVPAFSQALTIPTIPKITAPATTATVPRASDLTVTWTGGNRLAVTEFELYQMAATEVLTCAVTDTANSGTTTLPSTLLEMMTPGTFNMIGFSVATTTAMVGEFPTTFAVGGDLLDGAGGLYVGNLTLQ